MIIAAATNRYSAEAERVAHYQGDDHLYAVPCPLDPPCPSPANQPVPYNRVTNNGVRNYGLHLFTLSRVSAVYCGLWKGHQECFGGSVLGWIENADWFARSEILRVAQNDKSTVRLVTDSSGVRRGRGMPRPYNMITDDTELMMYSEGGVLRRPYGQTGAYYIRLGGK